jgi:hypothetical protein
MTPPSSISRFVSALCGASLVLALAGCAEPASGQKNSVHAGALAGTDSAGRGYRDDVEALINDKFSYDPTVRKVAVEIAKDYQVRLTTDVSSLQSTESLTRASVAVGACAARALRDRPIVLSTMLGAIKARTFNTSGRLEQVRRFESMTPGGIAIPLPKVCPPL